MQNDLVERLERALDPMNPVFRHDRDEAGKLAIAEIRRLRGLVEIAYREALWAGWNCGRAGETMTNIYARQGWEASDARATLSRLEPQIEGEGR